MKTSTKLFPLLALSILLNAGATLALGAAEPAKVSSVAKPASGADDTNDGACGCDDDEGVEPAVKTVEAAPAKKKTAKVTVSTTTKVTNTKTDGGTSKETTTAKYVNGELVSGTTTTTSGNPDATLARPIAPVTATPETK